MKFNYDMSENYRELYDEANGAFISKKKILKNDKTVIHKFTTLFIITFLKIEIMSVLALLIATNANLSFIRAASKILIITGILYLIFCFIGYFIGINSKMNSHKGSLEINSNGILDKSENGNELMFSYDNIELIVITKNLIVFITNTPIMIFIPNKDKNEIISKIKEYSKIKIIDKTI